MITVLQGTKCVVWSLNWSKLAIVCTVKASPIQEKKVFPQAPTNFLPRLGYEKLTRKHDNSATGYKMRVLVLKRVKTGYGWQR